MLLYNYSNIVELLMPAPLILSEVKFFPGYLLYQSGQPWEQTEARAICQVAQDIGELSHGIVNALRGAEVPM